MATSMQQAPTTLAADIVGNAFVHLYYLKLRQSLELVHKFYQDVNKHGRPEEDGAMSITTTMQAINDKILFLDHEEFSAEITTVDAQESYNGSVLVLVTGNLTGKDNVRLRRTYRCVPISSSPTQASLRSIKSQEQQPVASTNATVDNGNSQEGPCEISNPTKLDDMQVMKPVNEILQTTK
ncbi:hypothetical protein Q3G72_015276 [Acer saccharum]|nr:hypothetical protein Q3G72_015276 [Acer saccharum]